MIRLNRDRAAIPPAFVGAERVTLEQDLIKRHTEGTKPRSLVWKRAKDQLRTESNGKCAYCEADTSVVAHGDVEHFRPKSVYWWLAYCYDNYAFSCQICNQTFKSSQFPVHGLPISEPPNPTAGSLAPDPQQQNEVEAFLNLTRTEKAALPDPYVVDPERLFVWYCDDDLCEVEIRRRPHTPNAARAELAVNEALGLNREELRRLRYDTFREARILARIAAVPDGVLPDPIRSEATEILREMMSARSSFAAISRFVAGEHGLSLEPAG